MANDKIQEELAKLETSALLSLYVLDASEIGGDLFRFYPGVDVGSQPIQWQGVEYTPWPVDVKGFDMNMTGSPPRPSITFSNYNSVFSALILTYDDLIGSRLYRKRTFERFLDGRPDADPLQKYPDDIFFIERKLSETKFSVEFELVSAFELDDLNLPRRIVYSTLCNWKYRGPECSFAGDYPVADALDSAFNLVGIVDRGQWDEAATYHPNDYVYTVHAVAGGIIDSGTGLPLYLRRYFLCYDEPSVAGVSGEIQGPPNSLFWKTDACSKSIQGCTLRFGGVPLPFGGFPGTERFPF